MAAHDATQPSALFRSGVVTTPLQFGFYLTQLRRHPLSHRAAPNHETPVPRLPADVREAEETNRLRLAKATLVSGRGGAPPHLHPTSLAVLKYKADLV